MIDSLEMESSIALAQFAENVGFHEFWVTEHHSTWQSPNPRIMGALVASHTSRMRVGMGAVLARLHSAYSVAEDLHFLERLFPGRFRLGLAAGLPPKEMQTQLSGGELPTFEESVLDIIKQRRAWSTRLEPDDSDQVWICGTSASSARLALKLGTSFAFHHYLSREDNAKKAIVLREFAAQKHEKQQLAVAMYGLCGQSNADAERVWAKDNSVPAIYASFLGDKMSCLKQIRQLTSDVMPDILLLQSICSDWEARTQSYRNLADALL